MEVSLLLMQQIAQLFIVLIMGYVVVKAGLLKASDSKVLSVVFVYLVMPCRCSACWHCLYCRFCI